MRFISKESPNEAVSIKIVVEEKDSDSKGESRDAVGLSSLDSVGLSSLVSQKGLAHIPHGTLLQRTRISWSVWEL